MTGEALAQLRSAKVEFVDKLFIVAGFDDNRALNFVVLLLCSWAAVTSVSRVLLGRHFVCDVIAGSCLGILEALIVIHILNYSILSQFYDMKL